MEGSGLRVLGLSGLGIGMDTAETQVNKGRAGLRVRVRACVSV